MAGIVHPGVRSRVKGQFVKIGELAKQAGVSVDTVRYYERVGVLPAAERRPSGYREFTPAAVQRIELTRELQALGFTLAETVDALSAHDAGDASCETERWRLDAALERVDARLAELQALRDRIAEAQDACRAGRCQLSARSEPARRD